MLGSVGREFGGFEPIVLNGGDQANAFVELDGLAEVAVGAEMVAAFNVFVAVGSAEHDDGNVAKHFVAFDLFEDFRPAAPGEVQIEENKVGPGCDASESAALEEEFEGFLAVAADVNAVIFLGPAECFDSDFDVSRVVFHKQNFKCFAQCQDVLSSLEQVFR